MAPCFTIPTHWHNCFSPSLKQPMPRGCVSWSEGYHRVAGNEKALLNINLIRYGGCQSRSPDIINVTIIYVFYLSTFPSKYNWCAPIGTEKRNHRFFKVMKGPTLVSPHFTDESGPQWCGCKRKWRRQTICDFCWVTFCLPFNQVLSAAITGIACDWNHVSACLQCIRCSSAQPGVLETSHTVFLGTHVGAIFLNMLYPSHPLSCLCTSLALSYVTTLSLPILPHTLLYLHELCFHMQSSSKDSSQISRGSCSL